MSSKSAYDSAFKSFCDVVIEPVLITARKPQSLKNLLARFIDVCQSTENLDASSYT